MYSLSRSAIVVGVAAIIGMTSSCARETRILQPPPSGQVTLNSVQVSGINPGAYPLPPPPRPNIYQESAYSVSQGQSLFQQYNCSGCHANGGGGMGPPLIDNNWIYGGPMPPPPLAWHP